MTATSAPDLARVVAGHGRHVLLETAAGRRVIGHPRGKKSLCVVGDLVHWQPSGDEAVVEQIAPRRNLLLRQDDWRSKAFAANVDGLLVLVSGEPMFSESQLARALIAAADADIPARVLLNKTDLPAAASARERLAPYRGFGTEVVEAALKARPDEARERLAPLLAEGVTLLLGPSGSGKSTLINLLAAQAQAQVGEISRALGSGRHTTTATTWYWLDAQRRGALIDSPGFQEFGLQHVGAQRLAALMPDLRLHIGDCRFYNCTHRDEPGCGVRAALARGEIAPSRHRIYLEILDELTRPRW